MAFFILVFGVWYGTSVESMSSIGDIVSNFYENKLGVFAVILLVLFLFGFPLIFLPDFIHEVRVIVSGEIFAFDRDAGVIERNGTRCAVFSEVAGIRVKDVGGGDSPLYRLFLVMRNGSQMRLTQSASQGNLIEVAKELAGHVGVEIVRR